jgi:beta-glucosidase
VIDPDTSGVADAAALAAAADVAVVVVGDTLPLIGERCDRAELELTGGQLALLEAVAATGTPLVVVLINSKPLSILWIAKHAAAVVEAFNPGMAGGEAVAQVLFGEYNPSGRLTTSFPRSVGAGPVYYQEIPGWHDGPQPHYDPTPLYAFGFGLSYTSFAYAALRLGQVEIRRGNTIQLSVEVTNTGERGGVETVQVYLDDVVTSATTPSKALKAYRRVSLAPGESRTVSFELPFEDLSFVDAECRRVVEPGTFRVMVGASSRDQDLLSAEFELVD